MPTSPRHAQDEEGAAPSNKGMRLTKRGGGEHRVGASQLIPGVRQARWSARQRLHLRHEPRKVSKSRIKRLRGLERPQYRLRVGEIRVFYDVSEKVVEVLAIVSKQQAQDWLAKEGVESEAGSSGEG